LLLRRLLRLLLRLVYAVEHTSKRQTCISKKKGAEYVKKQCTDFFKDR
tara:strand:- start:457 stop:600 length:144 start_codon:yes stop_codon:yes gene_type:complete